MVLKRLEKINNMPLFKIGNKNEKVKYRVACKQSPPGNYSLWRQTKG
jgi:hypothetical protein